MVLPLSILQYTAPMRRRENLLIILSLLLLISSFSTVVDAVHHMKRAPIHWVNRRSDSRPLQVFNNCEDIIYPAIQTQAGTEPSSNGFKLSPGASKSLSVSADWQGRVWARTNCTFNLAGTTAASGVGPACLTGDCGGTVNCQGAVSGTL